MMIINEKMQEECFNKAVNLVKRGLVQLTPEMDIFQFADLLYKLETEKDLKNEITDSYIEYNDEIVSIEDVGILETIDISVSGDNLFYCNDILTKNSFGLPATCDLMFALISSEELEELGQISVKQLKNRYSDPSYYRKFVIGVDRSKMRLYDVEISAQENINDSGQPDIPAFDKTDFGKRIHISDRSKFNEFKF